MNIFSSFYPSAIFQETIEIKKECWTYTSPYMNNLSVYIIIDVGSKKKRKKEKKIK